VGPKTLRLAAEAGEIEAIHPLPNGPWIFSRAVLSTALARAITERARQNSRHPAGSHPDQQSLFSSMTQTDGCSDARLWCRRQLSMTIWASRDRAAMSPACRTTHWQPN